MYCDFWNLTHAPFHQKLDLDFFFESEIHEEALARLLYVADEQKKCALFTGPSGTGKTLTFKVLQHLFKRSPHHCEHLDLLGLVEEEILWQLCAQFRLGPAYDTRPAQLWRMLTDYLTGLQLTQNRVILLLDHVDQSHSGCHNTIERLLHTGNQRYTSLSIITTFENLNSETANAVSRFSDLAIELTPFDLKTTENYILHRLNRSGRTKPLFTVDAFEEIYKETKGVPKKVNQLSDLALLAGYEQNLQEIGSEVISRAGTEIKTAPLSINRISEVVQGV
ncbi:MAG: AAA family ATPase [Gimesia sp.]|nr:AAA family ATPase [Gimesia sp.]